MGHGTWDMGRGGEEGRTEQEEKRNWEKKKEKNRKKKRGEESHHHHQQHYRHSFKPETLPAAADSRRSKWLRSAFAPQEYIRSRPSLVPLLHLPPLFTSLLPLPSSRASLLT